MKLDMLEGLDALFPKIQKKFQFLKKCALKKQLFNERSHKYNSCTKLKENFNSSQTLNKISNFPKNWREISIFVKNSPEKEIFMKNRWEKWIFHKNWHKYWVFRKKLTIIFNFYENLTINRSLKDAWAALKKRIKKGKRSFVWEKDRLLLNCILLRNTQRASWMKRRHSKV